MTMSGGVALELLTSEAYERLARMGRRLYERLVWALDMLAPAFELKQSASLVSLAPATALQADATMLEVMRLLQVACSNRDIKINRNFCNLDGDDRNRDRTDG